MFSQCTLPSMKVKEVQQCCLWPGNVLRPVKSAARLHLLTESFITGSPITALPMTIRFEAKVCHKQTAALCWYQHHDHRPVKIKT